MKCGCSFNEPEGPKSLSDRWKITISTQCVRRRQRRWLRRRRLEMSTKYKRSAASRLFRMISLAKRKLWQLHAIRQSLSLSVAEISPTEIHYHRSEHWLCVANLIKSDNILSRSVPSQRGDAYSGQEFAAAAQTLFTVDSVRRYLGNVKIIAFAQIDTHIIWYYAYA